MLHHKKPWVPQVHVARPSVLISKYSMNRVSEITSVDYCFQNFAYSYALGTPRTLGCNSGTTPF